MLMRWRRVDYPGLYQGYVHVKTDQDNMVVPVDLNVIEGGLHVEPKHVDFGCITNAEQVRYMHHVVNSSNLTSYNRSLAIKLTNHGVEPISIVEVGLGSPDSSFGWSLDTSLEVSHTLRLPIV
jgi:hypothetical protein